MNSKRYLFSVVAVFVLLFCTDAIIHQYLLMGLYEQTREIWRAPQDMQMLPMFASQFFFALIFVFIFTRNYENKGIAEGVRYGLYIGLLLAAVNLATFGYLPIPFMLTVGWMLAAIVQALLAGVVVAALYRD